MKLLEVRMNKIFSPNMLKTFNECPYKYYLRYVKEISVPQKETPFEKGKKIHALANYYLRNNNIEKLESTLNSEEQKIWQTLKNNEYFNKTYVNSEYNLTCKIADFWIGGRIDAIVKDSNSYYIIDYKTGAIPKNPENDFQTIIYLLTVKKFFKDIKNLKFVYIDLKNNQNHVIEPKPEQYSKYENDIIQICKQINSTIYYEKNCNKYCEFQSIC